MSSFNLTNCYVNLPSTESSHIFIVKYFQTHLDTRTGWQLNDVGNVLIYSGPKHKET